MEENKKVPQKLSYESDGKMGKNNNKAKAHKKDQSEFFNTTQSSEWKNKRAIPEKENKSSVQNFRALLLFFLFKLRAV